MSVSLALLVTMAVQQRLDDVSQLAEQMARLKRIAHRVVWVNPHRGKIGYEPVQQGVMAALPFVDDFVAGYAAGRTPKSCHTAASDTTPRMPVHAMSAVCCHGAGFLRRNVRLNSRGK